MLTTLIVLSLTFGLPLSPVQAPQAAAVFEQGMPWSDYVASTKQQHDIWVRNAGRDVPAALVERLRKASSGLRLLAVAEDWCTDSVNSVPYLGSLATKAGVDLRIVNSEVGKSFMEAHRTPDGRAATPTIILIRDGKEVAAWSERPVSLQTWFLEMANKIDSSERQQRKLNWYDWNRGEDALKELVALAEQTQK